MGKAGVDSVRNDVHEQAVRAQRGGDDVANTPVGCGGLGGELWDVVIPVVPGPQEEGGDRHGRGTRIDAGTERRGDRRFGQFHMRRLHDRPSTLDAPGFDERLMASVRLGASRAMVDDDHAGGLSIKVTG